ncbi:MAG: cysteine--tRNA ligase [Armatimonadetes bacterium CG_4_10_14_3_um_filter_66_18]|nr:cysteine--tRNA ligase [Armatimonadota bacterium]OIO97454.1 MAG: cysteine--tRNA ligase [Armatimonadetes bacterium CG2_30_66_41]PIU88517.1 MAG: cysteine--tRNA ligase [Armatimonadetes bacterium CG06_land_8_20_14_3_00_66_21]PIX47437.1 MAG: cysteine--tRNA ligase [Armatimonadetes bacterium CG_4_8_14_3_um_filter_66_20]PIY37147.1 MAG: cysteine--tRNA ligase [Armatimonadetes bacterium CG_4_10_14_3_um_filter_66_18]PIZ47087.1 MAG: cysteine--tRNA ligase [Armatimonadetes bacterium CG_4_10_14_0_8_um_filte
MRVYNTLTKQKEDLQPREPGKVSMYVCGVTPYDYLHIGHARTFIVYDMIRRYLEHAGYEVYHLENITDVEDKIIDRASQTGEEPLKLAERFAREAARDTEALGLLKPHVRPKVSDHIAEIIELIERLLQAGAAYEAAGSVYFDVSEFSRYGQLSGRSLDDLPVERIEHLEEKTDPKDFALWKKAKEGEPAWESPWGQGRPGWHIECSAMSTKYLGPGFDVHGGARELIFPHHENELAQSEAGTGVHPFVRYWLHSGVLNVGGEKMSKSLGNFITVRDMLKRTTPQVLRMLFLTAHYRSPLDFTDGCLQQATAALQRVQAALREATRRLDQAAPGDEVSSSELTDAVESARDQFEAAMQDDLNTAQAIAGLFDLVTELNRLTTALPEPTPAAAVPTIAAARDTLVELFGVLGFADLDEELYGGSLAEELVELLTEYRRESRQQKNYQFADRIRDDLRGLGVALEDHSQGTSWHFDPALRG